MNCPIDNTELQMTDRQGVEIDYCPKCRGVWLDRGELDKLIERSADAPFAAEPEGYGDERDYDERRGGYGDEREFDDRRDGHGRRRRRRRSVLEDLFDFG